MLIDTTEIYVVQARPRAAAGQPAQAWKDVRQFDEDGPALDLADYLREDGDTEARVVRRWH
jgi:hypothetical protein